MKSPLWERYRRALGEEPLPAAFVDLDALDANIDAIARLVAPSGKALRVATKSVRSPMLIHHIQERAGTSARSLMTYTAGETAFLAREGHADLLLAYPTAQRSDAALLAATHRNGASAKVVVDDLLHLELLDGAAREAGTVIPVVIDADMAYRPFETIDAVHLGVRRSPLRSTRDVVGFAHAVKRWPGVRFAGVMAYEAQIAGVSDSALAARAMKAISRRDVATRRQAIADALHSEGFPLDLFNGGGTGSLASCVDESSLTEVTAGSGFLDSHLFDHYDGLRLNPAAYFALQVTRRPAHDIVTCHGGGFIASGASGKDRLPIPALPEGMKLTTLEGAGEVQTPLMVPHETHLSLGDPVFFRHAKAGELAEHFREYLLVRGEKVVGRAPTYRGLGLSFLG